MLASNGVKNVRIGSKIIGDGQPAYIIAEAGVNHNGQKEVALQLIDAALAAGADAVKFQTFTPEDVVSESAPQPEYQKENTGSNESQFEMIRRLVLPHETFSELNTYAHKKNIEFLSTPFGYADADFLEDLGVPAFKVSSGDLTNLPFLAFLAKKKRPLIISTGMATMEEIRDAVAELTLHACEEIIILQCTSEYPAPLSHANLRVIETLRKEFDHPIGFSDHTEGTITPVAAVAVGAKLIEKHFTTSRSLPGPDHKASLEPRELAEMIAQIRAVENGSTIDVSEEILGSSEKKPSQEEMVISKLVRRGIAARADIKADEVLTTDNTFAIRPEGEILPREWSAVIGKKARHDIPRGTSLMWDMMN